MPIDLKSMNHCLTKIQELIEDETGCRRSAFQLGYNLGRVAELASLSREDIWDPWKGPATDWDQTTLRRLAADLTRRFETIASSPGDSQ